MLSWLSEEEPHVVVGSKNKVKGNIKFEGLIRIEGSVEGQLVSSHDSKVIIAKGGYYIGELSGFTDVSISGRLLGDIDVVHLHIGSTGAVYGDIACSTILVDYGASIVGNIHIKEIDQIKDDSPMKDSIIEHDSRGTSSEMKSTVVEIDNPVSEVTIAVEDDKGVDVALNKAETMAPEKTFRVVLLILEPQMDFYADTDDDTAQHESSADRLASFIDRNRSNIDEIVVALDSHQGISITSSSFWDNKQGEHPSVGTLISMLDLQDGHWRPRKEDSMDYCIATLQQLESSKQIFGFNTTGKLSSGGIVIRPDQCLIGSEGSAIIPVINKSITAWTNSSLREIHYVLKSTSASTGHSNIANVLQRDPPDSVNADTVVPKASSSSGESSMKSSRPGAYDLRSSLRSLLAIEEEQGEEEHNNKLLICGQRSSHCNGFDVLELMDDLLSSSSMRAENVLLLRDAMSSGKSFVENKVLNDSLLQQESLFWQQMAEKGATITTTIDTSLQ